MPYKDKEKQKKFQKEWLQVRRKAFFSEKGPCVKCGSSENLEIDHINSFTKVSHRIWSWSEERRNIELAKCQVLCKICHSEKSKNDMRLKAEARKVKQFPVAQ